MAAEQSYTAAAAIIKDFATASLPEHVATHSHQTDYLAPLRTRQLEGSRRPEERDA